MTAGSESCQLGSLTWVADARAVESSRLLAGRGAGVGYSRPDGLNRYVKFGQFEPSGRKFMPVA